MGTLYCLLAGFAVSSSFCLVAALRERWAKRSVVRGRHAVVVVVAVVALLAAALPSSAAVGSNEPKPKLPPTDYTVTVRVVTQDRMPDARPYMVTSSDKASCEVWVLKTAVEQLPWITQEAVAACEWRIDAERHGAQRTPFRYDGPQCNPPRDVLEVALTVDRQALVRLWGADGQVKWSREHKLDDPLSTLWDR